MKNTKRRVRKPLAAKSAKGLVRRLSMKLDKEQRLEIKGAMKRYKQIKEYDGNPDVEVHEYYCPNPHKVGYRIIVKYVSKGKNMLRVTDSNGESYDIEDSIEDEVEIVVKLNKKKTVK